MHVNAHQPDRHQIDHSETLNRKTSAVARKMKATEMKETHRVFSLELPNSFGIHLMRQTRNQNIGRTGRHSLVWQFGRLSFAVILALMTSSPDSLLAQGDNHGIVVEGTGEVRSVPNVVEINLRLSAKGELTDDAVVKHRDSKKRAIETFKALNFENLELEEKNLGLKAGGNAQEMMQMMWNGMAPAANKRTQVEVGSTLRARLTGVDKMPTEELMSTIGKLLDAAQDSGAGLGMSDADMMMMRYYGWGRQPTSLVKFIVTNIKETREKAYDLAVKDCTEARRATGATFQRQTRSSPSPSTNWAT